MSAGSPAQRLAYATPWPAYALAWSADPRPGVRLAIGSCLEQDSNKIHVVEQAEDGTGALELKAAADHPLAPTKLMWRPSCPETGKSEDLLASASTMLQLWKLEEGKLRMAAKMVNTRSSPGNQGMAPVTAFDWSTENTTKIGSSSVDTTCTIWNAETLKIETQLIAHDKAVYDIGFAHQAAHFGSVSADGSLRLFDQRNLEHSTIIYETSPPSPLLRLAWNKLNPNHIATIAMDWPGVILIDIRRPYTAVARLQYRDVCVNSICWAPHSRSHLLAGGSDGCALIWDVADVPALAQQPPAAAEGAQKPPAPASHPPVLAHESGCGELYQVQWPVAQPDFCALGSADKVMMLDSLQRVEKLMEHPDFTLKNPNRLRSVVSMFVGSVNGFHKADGSGYAFMAKMVLEVDKINPQVASRMALAFSTWARLDAQRQALVKEQLAMLRGHQEDLSKDTFEVVSKVSQAA